MCASLSLSYEKGSTKLLRWILRSQECLLPSLYELPGFATKVYGGRHLTTASGKVQVRGSQEESLIAKPHEVANPGSKQGGNW